MRNKYICKKCINTYTTREWSSLDEERWNGSAFEPDRVVLCPRCCSGGFSGYILLSFPIHKDCHFYMEQIVMEQKQRKRK